MSRKIRRLKSVIRARRARRQKISKSITGNETYDKIIKIIYAIIMLVLVFTGNYQFGVLMLMFGVLVFKIF